MASAQLKNAGGKMGTLLEWDRVLPGVNCQRWTAPQFFILVQFDIKMHFPEKASVLSCAWGLVAELHLLRTTWTLPKLYGSWAKLPGSTAQRREWDPNPRKRTAYFNVKQTWNETFHVSSTNWNKTFLPQKRQNASLWSKKCQNRTCRHFWTWLF